MSQQDQSYAVIASGGKQHRVQEGEVLRVEKIEATPGDVLDIHDVLMIGGSGSTIIGTPKVDGAKVTAEVVGHGRGEKVKIIKFRRRKHSMKRQGHRQWFTDLKITGIVASGAKAPAKPKAEKAPAKPKAEAKPKAPAKPKAAPKATDGKKDAIIDISGIGPVIVDKLEAMGITTFEQIANWTPEDVERIDGELNFRGRIEREKWIEQAKEFIAKGNI